MSEPLGKFAETIFKRTYSFTPDETWERCARRVAGFVAGGDQELEDQFFDSISNRKFISGGRYLAQAGREIPQISNCFLLRAEDSRIGWGKLLDKHANCLMTGGGVGTEYSELRESGRPIGRFGGVSSGPIALMKMVNEVARWVRAGGRRRCIPEGTLIHTKKGLIPIEKIEKNEEVLTFDGYHKIIEKINQGKQPIVKINHEAGEFLCTANHRVAVLTSVNGTYVWKEARHLKEGDLLIFVPTAIEGKITNLPSYFHEKKPHSTTCKDIHIPSLDTEIAWLLGFLHGDGHVRKIKEKGSYSKGRVSFPIHKDQYDMKLKIEKQLSKFGLSYTEQFFKNYSVINVHSKQFAEYLFEFKQPNTEISIPSFILEGTQEIRAAYLSGVFDADGSSKTRPLRCCSSVYPSFIKQLQTLYSSLGIVTILINSTYNRPKKWKPLFSLNVKGLTPEKIFKQKVLRHSCKNVEIRKSKKIHHDFKIPFSWVPNKYRPHKNKNVGISIEHISKHFGYKYVPLKVKNTEDTKDIYNTWDIEVENRNEFVAEGLLVHNSACWSGLSWWHPDIEEFIFAKNWSTDIRAMKERDFDFPAPLDMTNISVGLDDGFFKAVKKKKEIWDLYYKAVKNACKSGEPGFSVNLKNNTNTILRNGCTEVTSDKDSDSCNLGSVNFGNIKNLDELEYRTRIGVRLLYLGTYRGWLPGQDFYNVRDEYRRIGLGIMGLHEWCIRHDQEYGPSSELGKWLHTWEQVSDDEADKISAKCGGPRPIAVRAIAPTGTISIIGETTSGIEPIHCVAYKRRFLDRDQKWKFQYVVDPTVERLVKELGINPDDIEDSMTLAKDVERRLQMQAFVQGFVDQGISSTINIPEWGEPGNNNAKQFAEILLKYLPKLRGVTVYPDGSRPGQPITKVKYETAREKENVTFEEEVNRCKDGVCGI